MDLSCSCGWSTPVAEITAHDDGVHVRGTIGLDRCCAPGKKRGLDQAIERHQPQQAPAQMLHRQRGRQQQPIREPPVGRRYGLAAVGRRAGHTGRQLSDGFHHQHGGRVSGIRESEQVTRQHRPRAARDQEHARGANDSEEQFQTADAAPFFGPDEQTVPRFGGVVQSFVDLSQGGQRVRGHGRSFTIEVFIFEKCIHQFLKLFELNWWKINFANKITIFQLFKFLNNIAHVIAVVTIL